MAKKIKNIIPDEYLDPDKNPEFNKDIIPDEDEATSEDDTTDFIYDDEDENDTSFQIPSPGEGP